MVEFSNFMPKELTGKTKVEDLQEKSIKRRRASNTARLAAQRVIDVRRRRTGDVLGSFNT